MEIIAYKRQYERAFFDCGHTSLNNYIHNNVSKDVKSGACTCFVILNKNERVIAFYTLSIESLSNEDAPIEFQRKIRYPYIPVILLGRLAIDKHEKGNGYGKLMLVDALKKCLEVAKNKIGAVAVIVDPIDKEAVAFYAKYGFTFLPTSGRMFMTMHKIEAAFEMNKNSGK